MFIKKRNNKRIFSCLLASAVVVAMLPTFAAGAASDEPLEHSEASEPVQEISILEDTEESEATTEAPEMVEPAEEIEVDDETELNEEDIVASAPDEVEAVATEPVPDVEVLTESITEMEATIPLHLTSKAAANLVTVARSQIGYRSTDDGYSRYADWCAQNARWWISGAQLDLSAEQRNAWFNAWDGMDSYSAWNASFVSFCLYYAGVEIENLPIMSSAEIWSPFLKGLGQYNGIEYTPKAGDLIFLDLHIGCEYAEERGFVGIVTMAGTEELWVVVGDYDGEVVEMPISLNDHAIVGYGVFPAEAEAAQGADEATVADSEETADLTEIATDEPVEEAAEVEPVLADANADEEPIEADIDLDGEAATYSTAYALAPEGYVLICRPNDLPEGMIYTVDGMEMLYTEESTYTSGKPGGVFVAMIPADAPAVLKTIVGERTELIFNCDINGDGVLNIADANAVYQMAMNGGDYYSVEQIGLTERLSLCFRSIEDLDHIVDIINGEN